MAKLDTYASLAAKYMDDAKLLLEKGDAVQAGEKLWGAAEAVRAAALKRRRSIKTHAQLWKFILDLQNERPELGLRRLFAVADHLHSNFYEDELPIEAVEGFSEDVTELVAKLEAL